MIAGLPPRIAAKILVCPYTGCWLWCGAKTHNGYPHSNRGRVHRVVYEALRGSIPAGLELDHICRVRCCVNPWHQRPLTTRENTLLNTGPTAANARKTACSGCGGPYSLEASTGRRICRPCRKAGRARRKAAGRGLPGASP